MVCAVPQALHKPVFLSLPQLPECDAAKKDDAMSNDVQHHSDPQDAALALLLANNRGDELTDILVAALEDAFRILDEDWASEAVH